MEQSLSTTRSGTLWKNSVRVTGELLTTNTLGEGSLLGELPEEMDAEQCRKTVSRFYETTGREVFDCQKGGEDCWGQRDNLGEKLRLGPDFH